MSAPKKLSGPMERALAAIVKGGYVRGIDSVLDPTMSALDSRGLVEWVPSPPPRKWGGTWVLTPAGARHAQAMARKNLASWLARPKHGYRVLVDHGEGMVELLLVRRGFYQQRLVSIIQLTRAAGGWRLQVARALREMRARMAEVAA